MDFGSRWRIETSLGWVHVRLLAGFGARPEAAPLEELSAETGETARSFLHFELGHSRSVQRALRELHAVVSQSGPGLSAASARDRGDSELNELSRFLDAELAAGRIQLGFEPFASTFSPRELLDIQLPSLGPARAASSEPSFISLHLVDQKGTPLKGRPFLIELPDGTVHRGATDPNGFGGVRGFTNDGTAKITFPKVDELEFKAKSAFDRRIIPVGENPEGAEEDDAAQDPSARSLLDQLARLDAGDTSDASSADEASTLATLSVELFDKTGRVRHAERSFQLTGPKTLSGTTDDQGRFRLEGVPPGDYTMELGLDFFLGEPDAVMDIMDVPLVVRRGDAQPQVRMVGAVPRSVMARLDMFFNTNKTFLLPTALPSVRKLRNLYIANAPCQLLVVGHADTRAGAVYNDRLSLERAKATIAYLKDDVEAWFKYYSDKESKQCWGKVEDHLMIISMPDFQDKPAGEDEIKWFQRTRGLNKVDGTAGDETRHALIEEYMTLDGASLKDFVGEIDATPHGCGENFPLDESGQELDGAPADEKRDRLDRRVELFFFDAEFGITPLPASENSGSKSTQYPTWRKRLSETVELSANDPDAPQARFVELADAHFRTNSAVVLPEGEDPDAKGQHRATTSVGLMATVLRFNEEQPGRGLFIAGHTDSASTEQVNDPLSKERAQVALALLTGDRESFKKLAHARHKGADINQIMSWVSKAFADLTFDCDPGKITEGVSDVNVRKFQREYNRNKPALGVSFPDLKVDGSVGEDTWAAFFDCYEFALQQELGESASNLAGLRSKLRFVDDSRKALGFGERFPIEELGVDEFRSQTNRRVEIFFFEQGEEPNLAQAQSDADTSDLYLPGQFVRSSVPPLLSAKPFKASWDALTASVDVTRQIQLSAPELPAGTPLAVEVRLVGVGTITTLTASSSTDGATISFNDWDAPAEVPFVGDLQAGQPFPPSLVEFVVQGGGRRVQTATPLTYADSATMILTADDEGERRVLVNENYVLCTPFGRRQGVTDAQGGLVETNLPIGGGLLALRGRHLVHSLVLDHGWDGEEPQ